MSVDTAASSDEDQLAAALSDIREARSTGATDTQQAAVVDSTAAAPAVQPAEEQHTQAADAPAPAATPGTKTLEQELAEKRAELQRVNSELGRVSALNRANQEKAQEIAQLREQIEALRKPPETQAEARSRFAELAEKVADFPELHSIVEAVDKALSEVEGKVQASATQAAQEAMRPLEPLRQQHLEQQQRDTEAATAADMDVFKTTYPQAVEVIRSDDFKAWLPKQPPATQYSFRNGETPAEALAVMDAYDAHLRRSGKPSIAHTPTPQQPDARADKDKPANSRLTRAAGIETRATNGSKGIPSQDDFDGSLTFFRERRLQQARA